MPHVTSYVVAGFDDYLLHMAMIRTTNCRYPRTEVIHGFPIVHKFESTAVKVRQCFLADQSAGLCDGELCDGGTHVLHGAGMGATQPCWCGKVFIYLLDRQFDDVDPSFRRQLEQRKGLASSTSVSCLKRPQTRLIFASVAL